MKGERIMKQKYCGYCHSIDLGELVNYGDKYLWQRTGSFFGSKITLQAFVENGKLCIDNNHDSYICEKPINYCPMCGEKLSHK